MLIRVQARYGQQTLRAKKGSGVGQGGKSTSYRGEERKKKVEMFTQTQTILQKMSNLPLLRVSFTVHFPWYMDIMIIRTAFSQLNKQWGLSQRDLSTNWLLIRLRF